MKRIKGERATISLTQKQLAEKFCVDERTVRRWETGKTDVPSSILSKLANLFGCTTDYLLERTETRV